MRKSITIVLFLLLGHSLTAMEEIDGNLVDVERIEIVPYCAGKGNDFIDEKIAYYEDNLHVEAKAQPCVIAYYLAAILRKWQGRFMVSYIDLCYTSKAKRRLPFLYHVTLESCSENDLLIGQALLEAGLSLENVWRVSNMTFKGFEQLLDKYTNKARSYIFSYEDDNEKD